MSNKMTLLKDYILSYYIATPDQIVEAPYESKNAKKGRQGLANQVHLSTCS